MTQLRILIADDHGLVRQALKTLINKQADLTVVGEADNGHSAVALAQALQPDVVLLDLSMPQCDGLKAAQGIAQQAPGSKVIILSTYDDAEVVDKCLEAGAAGYLTKRAAAQELLHAIHTVAPGGQRYYSPSVARRLRLREYQAFLRGPRAKAHRNITGREAQVLKLLALGLVNKQIADQLNLSVKTVEKHRQSMMGKLHIHHLAGLTHYAVCKGMIPEAPHQMAAAT